MLATYWIAINYPFHESSAQIHADALTMAYATLGVIQLFHAFNSKSIHGTIFSKETFNNKYFNVAVFASAVLLAMTIFVPAFNSTFHVTTLALEQWGIVLGAGSLMIIIVEVVKFFQRKFIYKD